MTLQTDYERRRRTTLAPLAVLLEKHISDLLRGEPRIDRVSARAKDVDSFLDKASKTLNDGAPKYADPMVQIQDQVGARIVTFYRSDIERVSAVIDRYFRQIEFQEKTPVSEWEFGYFGHHFVLLVPTDLIDSNWSREDTPPVFELQLKTLFQHSWSEANHDLGYKPEDIPFLSQDKRLLAYASAQAWGADRIFDEMFLERRQRETAPA